MALPRVNPGARHRGESSPRRSQLSLLRQSYTVPLPAALFLLLLLALVFHHQLKQIAGEADDLVRVALKRAAPLV